jgi:hypothetical protein
LPALGAVVSAVAVGTTFGGPAYISVHMVLLLVLVQAAWMVWTGVLLMRQPER